MTEHHDQLAPQKFWALGNLDIISQPKTALFCSARYPGDAILRAYDQAAHWRDTGRCIVSGFHSPVENECLKILLRGKQPVIICLARSLEKMRLPADWQRLLAAGRLLILSAFGGNEHRITSALAMRRNEFVAALANEICVVCISFVPKPQGDYRTVSSV